MNEADHYNYRDLAFYYKKLGEFDACLKNAQTATDMEPDWEWGYYYTAECHLNNGDTSQAFEAIKASVLNGLDAMTRNEFAAELLGAGAPILAARLGLMRIR
jgi:tetratricopeptide (TPR) repeat protein